MWKRIKKEKETTSNMKKIPRIGQKVYLFFNDCVSLESVYMKGKESFACNSAFNYLYIDEYRVPFLYDEYGKTWFTSLSDLKKAVLEPNEKLVKIHENYWEIEEKEE